jgi:hypothetical protein
VAIIFKAIDDDLNEDLNFAFASGFVASNDSQGLDGIAEPFQIADNTGKKNILILVFTFSRFNVFSICYTADHGRADWLRCWDEFVQKARFKKWFVYIILSKTT